jgi:predicted phosphoribosyltransferase
MIRLPFQDREAAGKLLGEELAKRNYLRPVVIGLARGGVAVAAAVAASLSAPLDALIVRKIGVPWREELAMGAIAGGKVQTLDRAMIRALKISQADVDEVVARETAEAARQEKLFRQYAPEQVQGHTAILVDDGLATGSSMQAAVQHVRAMGPIAVIVAVPVGPQDACVQFRESANECVCLASPLPFYAVSAWYQEFGQTGDEEVCRLLEHSRRLQRV